MNVQIPARKDLRTPSSCRGVFQHPPAHPFPSRVKTPEVVQSLATSKRPSFPSHLPVDLFSSTLRTPPDQSLRAPSELEDTPFPAAPALPHSPRWPPASTSTRIPESRTHSYKTRATHFPLGAPRSSSQEIIPQKCIESLLSTSCYYARHGRHRGRRPTPAISFPARGTTLPPPGCGSTGRRRTAPGADTTDRRGGR